MKEESVVEPVMVDWNMRGLDFLAFFPERYPALAFLRGDAYETLSDDLARQVVSDVVAPLSTFLAEHDHELWELGAGGDSFDLVIVPAGGGNALRTLWMSPDENGVVFCDPVRIAPDAPRTGKGRRRRPPSKKPVDLVVASQTHRHYSTLDLERSRFVIAPMAYGDEVVEPVLDTRAFPMAPLQAPGIEALRAEGWSISPLHASDRHQYFRLTPQGFGAPLLTRLVVMDGASAEPRDLLDPPTVASERVPGQAWPAGADDVLFFVVDAERPAGFEVHRARGAAVDVVARLDECPQELLALSESRVLAPFGRDHDEIERVRVIDAATRTVHPDSMLAEVGSCLFALDAEEIVYLHVESHPHPERDALSESAGWLIRHHLGSGRSRRADLEGLRTTSSISLRPRLSAFTDDRDADEARFMSQAPVKHKLRSFPGFMRACRGHGDWVILNWIRLHDLAWLWNTATDEVIRIRARDFAREEPRLCYSPAFDRYLASHSCRLDLLLPFDDLCRACEKTRMVWR